LALARLCGLDEVDLVVVDSGLNATSRAMLEQAGVTIHIAPLEDSRANGAILELSRSDGVRNDS
jgi:hypothetical protein